MPEGRPRVSIIIVTWNALPLLKRCLPSVVNTAYENLEVVLADNASTDGSCEWVRAQFPDVNVVRHPENWMFCRGNNQAVPHTSGKYVVLLNNDVEVPSGWLDPLVDAVEAHDDVGAVQPKILQHGNRSRFEYAGASGGFLDRFGYPFTRGRILFHLEDDRGQYDDARDIFWATGAAVLLRRSALEKVGLLDEHFTMHMEEIDLCWRLLRSGYRVRVEPRSAVYHIGGGSLPKGNTRKIYFNFRNSLLLLYKHLPESEWKRVFGARCLLDAAASARALAAGRPTESAAIMRAYTDAHRIKDVYADIRPATLEETVRPTYRGSIVYDYYVRRRRCFSDLPEDSFA